MTLQVRSGGWVVSAFLVVLSLFTVAASAQDRITIVGSGSNLPRPLYDAWVSAFNRRNPKAQVQYLPLGTAVSIKQISSGSGDFGGGEVPLTGDILAGSHVKLMDVPVGLVAVVPIYNLPNLGAELRFSGEALANIYLGSVRNWDDPEIARLNPGVKLPSLAIQVVHRSEGKGANYIFSDFLSKESTAFRQRIGKSASPKWVLGASAMRNEDMAEQVASTAGAIGYVELNYAAGGVSVGRVQNAAGRFVKASQESVASACAEVARSGMASLQASLTNAPGGDSYPLSSFTYIYLPRNMSDKNRARVLDDFVDFILGEGQTIARDKNYAALPSSVLQKARAAVHKATSPQ